MFHGTIFSLLCGLSIKGGTSHGFRSRWPRLSRGLSSRSWGGQSLSLRVHCRWCKRASWVYRRPAVVANCFSWCKHREKVKKKIPSSLCYLIECMFFRLRHSHFCANWMVEARDSHCREFYDDDAKAVVSYGKSATSPSGRITHRQFYIDGNRLMMICSTSFVKSRHLPRKRVNTQKERCRLSSL